MEFFFQFFVGIGDGSAIRLFVGVFGELVDELAGESKFVLKLAHAIAKELFGREDIGHLDAIVGGKGEWISHSLECQFGFCLIKSRTDQNAKCWVVFGHLNESVDCIDIEVELAGKLWDEGLDFEFDNNVTTESDMVKKEVNSAIGTRDEYFLLTSHE